MKRRHLLSSVLAGTVSALLPVTALAYAVPTPHVVVDSSWDWWIVGERSEQERLDNEEDLIWTLQLSPVEGK